MHESFVLILENISSIVAVLSGRFEECLPHLLTNQSLPLFLMYRFELIKNITIQFMMNDSSAGVEVVG